MNTTQARAVILGNAPTCAREFDEARAVLETDRVARPGAVLMKTAHQLRKGDIVRFHGGRFEVLADPRLSSAHQVEGYWPRDSVGPTACVSSPAVCLEGRVSGYFAPGTEWNFQGNTNARFAVEAF